jgi:hypothetical protein
MLLYRMIVHLFYNTSQNSNIFMEFFLYESPNWEVVFWTVMPYSSGKAPNVLDEQAVPAQDTAISAGF